MNYVTSLLTWIRANPVFFSVVIWPIITGIVLGLFKPRTPEDYSKMNPRVAGFLIFLSGLGFDPSKMLQGLFRALTGTSIPISAAKARDLLQDAKALPSTPSPDLRTAATPIPPQADAPPESPAKTE